MSGYGPPDDVPAARLFRLLCDPDGPHLPIGYRLRCAPSVALGCRAPLTRAYLEATRLGNADLASRLLSGRALIASTLTADGDLAFSSAEAVGQLYSDEALAIEQELRAALRIIAPIAGFSDWQAWTDRLTAGAKDLDNHGLFMAMAGTVEPVAGFREVVFLPHPERYYGKAVALLTDGQLWAYGAVAAEVKARKG